MSRTRTTQDNGAATQVAEEFAKSVVRFGLNNAFPDGDCSAKRVAKAANLNHRTVEGWRAGRSLPSLPAFLHLAMKVPGLRAEILRILGDEDDFGPERALHEIQLVLAAYGEKP